MLYMEDPLQKKKAKEARLARHLVICPSFEFWTTINNLSQLSFWKIGRGTQQICF